MSKEIKNVAASVKSKLLNIARSQNKSFNILIQLYMQERLLYRLSNSKYRERFILKGGLFLYIITGYNGRPTRDIDFLGQQISNDMNAIAEAFKEVCNIDNEDGIVFDTKNLKVEKIRKDAKYEGVRIIVDGYLGKAKQTLQIDIGFGEVIVPKPVLIEKATLLNADVLKLNAYSIESVISEKFEAMISLADLNGRLKDFYDIYDLSSKNNFDGRVLQQAIFETFDRRGTLIEKHPIVFEDIFINNDERNRQWNLFLKKISESGLAFKEVMQQITIFIKPIYDTIIEEGEFFGIWSRDKKKWESYTNENNLVE